MGRPAVLEAFDDELQSSDLADPAGSQAWADGHAAGLAEAHNQALADIERLQEGLVRTFEDMAFGYAEARASLLSDLGPLFEAAVTQFFPALAREAMIPKIRDALADLAAERLDQPLTLCVPPDQVSAVQEALAGHAALPFEAISDATLGPNQAIVAGGAQDMIVDLDGLVSLVRESFDAIEEKVEERLNHG